MPTFRTWLLAFVAVLARLFPVRTRRGVLTLVLSLQALVLAIGLGVVFQDVRHRVAVKLQDQILDQNIRTATSLANTMDSLKFGPAFCGSMGRERAQKMIEEMKLPASAFVLLLDEQNKIICHPDLRTKPELCGIDLTKMEVMPPGDTGGVTIGGADRGETLAGRAQFLKDGTHYIAAKYVPSMQASVVVQQPESGLLALGEAVASGTMLRAAGLGIVILSLTGTISFVLIRRHNRVLESINEGLEVEVAERVSESLAARHSLIIGLAKLAESRDSDTGAHLDRICEYSELLGKELAERFPAITPMWLANLRLASTLHDIGKVGIPDAILLKPGRLTVEERAVMEQHPMIGAETLRTVRERLGDDAMVNLSLEIALSHHEKWDGSGYPQGLRGEAIPLSARIVALADVYDALTSARVYKPAMSHTEASKIIREGAGKHFDPDVVAAFERVQAEFDRVRGELQESAGEAARLAA